MKVALVTGVSSGIGKATAARLAQMGFRTFGTVRTDATPQPGLELVRVDVRDDRSVKDGVAKVLELAGRIDVLVNNAGAALIGPAEETSIDEARELFETNFFGLLRMTQAVLPAMRSQRSGRIVNISSVLGFLPAPYMSVYAASKHAVEGYSESLDHEVRGFGVRVIAVEPAFTRTSISRQREGKEKRLSDYNDVRQRVAERINDNIAHGADPSVVADVVARAVTDPTPRLRYPVGRQATLLSILRSIAPASVLDKGIRKRYGLAAA